MSDKMIDKLFERLKKQFGYKPMTLKEEKKRYQKPRSISEQLLWTEYDAATQSFPLADGKGVAAVFELLDVSSEARSKEYLQQLETGLQGLFQDVFSMYFDDECPWILQFYLQDELSFNDFYKSVEDYVKIKDCEYARSYLSAFKEHCDYMTQDKGIFFDDKVSGNIFRGKRRRIRAVIYRRLTGKAKIKKGKNAFDDLNDITKAFISKLEGVGVKVKRYTGCDFYNWMVKWFNPRPKHGFGDPDILLERCPYPESEKMPFGYDFAEKFFYSLPESDAATGVWYFDGLPHKFISITGVNTIPKKGHLSLERQFGNHFYALFDKFPEGSVFVLTIVLRSQDQAKNHIFNIENSSKRLSNTEAEMTREDCYAAKRNLESRDFLFPITMGVYIKGNDSTDLYSKETDVETLLSNNGLIHVNGDDDLTSADSYLRFFPMNYSYLFDKQYMSINRLMFARHLARMMPLYGRERGSGNPGVVFYNRCGEPLTFDPFNSKDKDNNSHLLLLGSTGSGKSATCVYLMMHLMAVYRPRFVVIDAGNSFFLLNEHFKSLGLKVNRVEIAINNPPALNPFADSEKMIKQFINTHSLQNDENIKKIIEKTEFDLEEELKSLKDKTENTGEIENRDYLGEMALAAQLMITGGEQKEQDKITRQDRMFIIDAILRAAMAAYTNKNIAKRGQMIASDLVAAFNRIADELVIKQELEKAARIREMADSINFFCKDHLSSLVFNSPGKPWPDADVTMFEMGIFKDEGYEAHRALAFMGAMNKTMSMAEKNQYDERFTVFYGDEIHIITKNVLTAVYLTKCSKMSRKIGLWLWLATQNVADFPDDASKMLSMMEFWLCLGMSEAEMKEVERFKPLTEEERELFRSVRKSAGKYVELVLLSNRFKALCRNIPPLFCLALAMTEKHEKAQRKKLMEKYGCSELNAAYLIAADMMGKDMDETAMAMGTAR